MASHCTLQLRPAPHIQWTLHFLLDSNRLACPGLVGCSAGRYEGSSKVEPYMNLPVDRTVKVGVQLIPRRKRVV